MRRLSLLLLVATFGCGITPAQESTATHDPAGRALEIVAAREGVPIADLEISNSAKSTYREQGVTFDSFKVHDRVRQTVYLVSLDAAGNEVDAEAMSRADYDLARQRRGALGPLLSSKIATAGPDDRFDVVISVQAPASPLSAPTGSVTPEQVDAFLAAASAKRRAEVSTAIAPVMAVLQARGIAVTALDSAAFIYGRLSVRDIQEISRLAEIVEIEEQARGVSQ